MTSRLGRGWLAVAWALACFPRALQAQPNEVPGGRGGAGRAVGPGDGHASEPQQNSDASLRIAQSGCSFGTERIQELLRLETTTIVPTLVDLPPLDIGLLCDGDRVKVTIADSITEK
jgi:hypothetical protein